MRLCKATVIAAAFVGLVCITPTGGHAVSYQVESTDHPVRLVTYPIYAVGKGIEVFVARPIHWLASQPKLRCIFGTTSNPRTDVYCGDLDECQRFAY